MPNGENIGVFGKALTDIVRGYRGEQANRASIEGKKELLKLEQDKIKILEKESELKGREILKPGEKLVGAGGEEIATGGVSIPEPPTKLQLQAHASGMDLQGNPIAENTMIAANKVLNVADNRVGVLSKDFEGLKDVKTFRTFRDQYNKMESTWQEVQALSRGEINEKTFVAADQAIINIYNKMLDPNSVVRESEFARTAEGAALMNRIFGYFKRTTEGGISFTNTERKALVRMARRLTTAAEQEYNLRAINYRNRGEKIFADNLDDIAEISRIARPWEELASPEELESGDVIVPGGGKPPLGSYIKRSRGGR